MESLCECDKACLPRKFEIRLVIYMNLLESWLELQPVFITEYEAGHSKFASVLCRNCNDTNL